MRRRNDAKPASWAAGPAQTPQSEGRSSWRDELPDKFECKHLVIIPYAAFLLCLAMTLAQGFWGIVGPFATVFYNKIAPVESQTLGGKGADVLFVQLGKEYLGGTNVGEHKFGPGANIPEGEAIKECRLYCVKNPYCVFFTVHSYPFYKAKSELNCFLKGWDVDQRVASERFDSGVLLNRIPKDARAEFSPTGSDVYVVAHDTLDHHLSSESDHRANHANKHGPPAFLEGDEAPPELRPSVHSNAAWVSDAFPYVAGPMSEYLSRFLPEDLTTSALVPCARAANQRLGETTEWLYKRSSQKCYLPPFSPVISQSQQSRVKEREERWDSLQTSGMRVKL
jgi:hypothetical protein